MNKYFIIWIALIMYSGSLYAGHVDSVKSYYEFKNQAEMQIIDSNYGQSLMLYKKAFQYKKPNAFDLYNAMVVSYFLKDSLMAKFTFNQLAAHGLEKDKFEISSYFSNVKEEPTYKWITNQYDSLYAVALSSELPVNAKILDSILDADQRVRKIKKPTAELKFGIISTDISNLKFLKEYIQKHGFLGYDMVGSFEKVNEGWFHGLGTLWFVLWHTRNISKILNPILLKAVKNGEYNPDEYALIVDMQNPVSVYYNVLPRTIDKDKKSTFLPIANSSEINKKRAEIFLDKVENYKKKLLYQNEHGSIFRFAPGWAFNCNFSPIDLRTWK
jgi:hypothetical protein